MVYPCQSPCYPDPRRSLAADAVDVVVAFSQGGTMLAIYMDEMRKARRWLFKGDVISQEMMGLYHMVNKHRP